MIYLDKDDIILINQLTIDAHGGNYTPPFNILKEEPLDYVVDIVQADIFGEPMFLCVKKGNRAFIYFMFLNY